MALSKPAQASGTVSPSTTTSYSGGPGSGNCIRMNSPDAVRACSLNFFMQGYDQSMDTINSAPYVLNLPISCPSPHLEIVTPNSFKVTYSFPGITRFWGPQGWAYCGTPYVATYTIVSFKEPLACPPNSTGTPETSCICNDDYVPDSTATNCIPEPLTIALHGLGGEVMPTKTRAAYAEVTKSDGSAKVGASVSLSLAVEPEGGGPIRAEHVGTISPNGGSTGADGRLSFEFRAPTAGGTHTLTATCTNCTNQASGEVKVPGCPIPALTEPSFDACATVLENLGSTQAQKDAACGTLSSALVDGRNCLSTKLSRLSPTIPLAVTSDIRSVAYQAHLRQVWDRMEDVVQWMTDNPTIQTACAARRAEIAAEKGCDNADGCTNCYAESASQRSHCLAYRPANPSPSDAKHTQGQAFDASRIRTINPLRAALAARTPPENIQQFLNAPTNCNLSWGGEFSDPVHFYVP